MNGRKNLTNSRQQQRNSVGIRRSHPSSHQCSEPLIPPTAAPNSRPAKPGRRLPRSPLADYGVSFFCLRPISTETVRKIPTGASRRCFHHSPQPDRNAAKVSVMSMFTRIVEGLHGAKIEGLAKTFSRLGKIGFWLQVVLGSIPLAVTFFVFVFSGSI
ncbi:DUF3611 family protein, partial [uncultured Lamprocystis sp.]|uniref:DUF3611 family protein n=1 Tax=uncultured Lamprocystis sp. TaxID=543132 RepID=UPI00341C1395